MSPAHFTRPDIGGPVMRRSEDKEEKFGGYNVLGADAIATIPLLLATVALVLVTTREVAMGLGVAVLGMLPAGMVPVSWDPAILGGSPLLGAAPYPSDRWQRLKRPAAKSAPFWNVLLLRPICTGVPVAGKRLFQSCLKQRLPHLSKR